MRYFFDFFLTFFKSAGAAYGPGIYLVKVQEFHLPTQDVHQVIGKIQSTKHTHLCQFVK